MNDFLIFFHAHGLLWIPAVIFGALIAEDMTGIIVGIMAARGDIGFAEGALVFFTGIYLSDFGLYCIGRWLGRGVSKRRPLSWFVKEEDIERYQQWFRDKGLVIIFISRFIPGARLPVFVSAGISKISLVQFCWWLFWAAALWAPVLVGGAMLFGRKMMDNFIFFQKNVFTGFILLVIFIFIIVHVLIPLFNFNGRRQLAIQFKWLMRSLRRLTRR